MKTLEEVKHQTALRKKRWVEAVQRARFAGTSPAYPIKNSDFSVREMWMVDISRDAYVWVTVTYSNFYSNGHLTDIR